MTPRENFHGPEMFNLGLDIGGKKFLNSYSVYILGIQYHNKISSLLQKNAHTRLKICALWFEHHKTNSSVPHVAIELWVADVTPARM